jgi:hypothetical protein
VWAWDKVDVKLGNIELGGKKLIHFYPDPWSQQKYVVQLGVNVFRDVLLTAQLRQLFNGLKYCATLLKPGMNLRSAILSTGLRKFVP